MRGRLSAARGGKVDDMSDEPKLNIYQRLSKAREAVSYLQKTKEVAGRYKAITHDEVTAAARPHFIAQGILLIPQVLTSAMVPTGTSTAKGIPILRYEARFAIRFTNIDEPSDVLILELDAHALDEGDKAPGKAVSYATKTAILKVLNIETGEDDEDRISAKIARKIQSDKGKITSRAGAMESLSEAEQRRVMDASIEVLDAWNAGDLDSAFRIHYQHHKAMKEFGPEADVALWDQYDSKLRSALKKRLQEVKAAQDAQKLASQA